MLVIRSSIILVMPFVLGVDLFTDDIGDTCIAGSDPTSQLLVMLESKGDATTRN